MIGTETEWVDVIAGAKPAREATPRKSYYVSEGGRNRLVMQEAVPARPAGPPGIVVTVKGENGVGTCYLSFDQVDELRQALVDAVNAAA